MKILISTHHFLGYTGTEIYIISLIKELLKNGHQVVFYSKYLSLITDSLKNFKNLEIVSNLSLISKYNFDIIHTNHNINAIELRNYFPNVPLIFHSHGTKPFLEQPPIHDVNINKYLAVSEYVKKNLISKGVHPSLISISRNLVDEKVFFEINHINSKPRKALIFSNYNDSTKDNLIMDACKASRIKFDFIGGYYGQIENNSLNSVLNKYDLVFTAGRGAMESLLAGRATIIINSRKMGKMVTPLNFKKMIKNNLSGNYYCFKITKKRLESEIKKYNPKNSQKLSLLTKEYFGSSQNIKSLIAEYQQVIDNFKSKTFDHNTNNYIFNTIKTTRDYCQLEYFHTKQELDIIKKSKVYKIYQLLKNLKNK